MQCWRHGDRCGLYRTVQRTHTRRKGGQSPRTDCSASPPSGRRAPIVSNANVNRSPMCSHGTKLTFDRLVILLPVGGSAPVTFPQFVLGRWTDTQWRYPGTVGQIFTRDPLQGNSGSRSAVLIGVNSQNCYRNNAADFETTCATPHAAGISTTIHASATFNFSNIRRRPVMRGINRPHESVGNESDNQQ